MDMESEIAKKKANLEIRRKISDVDNIINHNKNNKNKTPTTRISAKMSLSKSKATLSTMICDESELGEE